jgi:hypothetical protein
VQKSNKQDADHQNNNAPQNENKDSFDFSIFSEVVGLGSTRQETQRIAAEMSSKYEYD